MARAASAGVAMPPATKSTTGRRPLAATVADEVVGRLELLGGHEQLVLAHALQPPQRGRDGADVADGLDDVAGARLALGADHRGALVDAPQRLAEVAAAAHERHLEGVLVDVVGLVGRREDLRLVDVVDAQRLQDLRLDEVADAGLGHDRDGDGLHDAHDHRRVAHARHAARRPDVGRHALEGHHRDGAGILGDARLVGRDDVHDDAALEHLGEALLGRPGGGLYGHGGQCSSGGREGQPDGRPRGRRPFGRPGSPARSRLSHGPARPPFVAAPHIRGALPHQRAARVRVRVRWCAVRSGPGWLRRTTIARDHGVDEEGLGCDILAPHWASCFRSWPSPDRCSRRPRAWPRRRSRRSRPSAPRGAARLPERRHGRRRRPSSRTPRRSPRASAT